MCFQKKKKESEMESVRKSDAQPYVDRFGEREDDNSIFNKEPHAHISFKAASISYNDRSEAISLGKISQVSLKLSSKASDVGRMNKMSRESEDEIFENTNFSKGEMTDRNKISNNSKDDRISNTSISKVTKGSKDDRISNASISKVTKGNKDDKISDTSRSKVTKENKDDRISNTSRSKVTIGSKDDKISDKTRSKVTIGSKDDKISDKSRSKVAKEIKDDKISNKSKVSTKSKEELLSVTGRSHKLYSTDQSKTAVLVSDEIFSDSVVQVKVAVEGEPWTVQNCLAKLRSSDNQSRKNNITISANISATDGDTSVNFNFIKGKNKSIEDANNEKLRGKGIRSVDDVLKMKLSGKNKIVNEGCKNVLCLFHRPLTLKKIY